MVAAVVILGACAQLAAWALVASGRGSVWTAVAPVIAAAGATAAVVAPPPLSGRVGVGAALASGVAAGLLLYAGTLVFVMLAGRWWPAFVRHADAIYRHRGDGLAPWPLVVAAVVAVGEELFWRGVAQRELATRLGAAGAGAAATLVVYVAVNVPSRNLAIVAGAVVGGAVWGTLAWWSSGVLASVLAHALWTALMIVRPVARAAA